MWDYCIFEAVDYVNANTPYYSISRGWATALNMDEVRDDIMRFSAYNDAEVASRIIPQPSQFANTTVRRIVKEDADILRILQLKTSSHNFDKERFEAALKRLTIQEKIDIAYATDFMLYDPVDTTDADVLDLIAQIMRVMC